MRFQDRKTEKEACYHCIDGVFFFFLTSLGNQSSIEMLTIMWRCRVGSKSLGERAGLKICLRVTWPPGVSVQALDSEERRSGDTPRF